VLSATAAVPTPSVLVCLLGSFRVLKGGVPLRLPTGGKVEQLLGTLAVASPRGVPRGDLLGVIWPDSEPELAKQSLNSLVYTVHRLLRDALTGGPAVLVREGQYRLNTEAGVDVDVSVFDATARRGDRLAAVGDRTGAIDAYTQALEVYVGDLAFGSDVRHLVEGERLRSRHLAILARIADQELADGEYGRALDNALELLAHDPCREDAHRMAMRCFVRLGFRAQALRQYAICRQVLSIEFAARPEPETEALYEAIRLDPIRV
jgi:DNA-binding SARP family transcriptional activator